MSNDDTTFSEMYTVHVYKSECQKFNNDSGDISFTLKVIWHLNYYKKVTFLLRLLSICKSFHEYWISLDLDAFYSSMINKHSNTLKFAQYTLVNQTSNWQLMNTYSSSI